ncbi:MAG: hypothetical protein IMZ62_00645 [Chloroflexi bacterium]|nr:hypothetical protein [Chloroflexota bacterium]
MKESEASSPTGAENVTWNLDDLVAPPVEGGIESVLAKAVAGVDAFAAKYRGKLAGLSALQMKELLTEYEALVEAVGRVESSAYCRRPRRPTTRRAARFCRRSPGGSRRFHRRRYSWTSSGPMRLTMQRGIAEQNRPGSRPIFPAAAIRRAPPTAPRRSPSPIRSIARPNSALPGTPDG